MGGQRVLLIAINYWPELVGIGKYTGEMGEWLAQQGFEVRVITAPPYYPAWRVDAKFSSWRYSRERVRGVDILRCPLWVPARLSGLKRILHLASFALTSLPLVLCSGMRWRPDIVFVVEPPLFCAPAALIAAKLASARAWLHVQDMEVDVAFELGILRLNWLRKLILRADTWLMKRFDTVSTISVKMLERLEKKGVKPERYLLFENWVETDRIYPLLGVPLLHSELNLPDKMAIVLYSGNMGEKQGLELVIQAAEILKSRNDLFFLLCGTGASMARLKQMAKGLDNVLFRPLQPLDKLNELLNLANIHLLPQRSGAEDLGMPSKLTNMMASGKPVVATALPGSQIANVLEGRGVVVNPDDLDALCRAIEYLLDNETVSREMGKNGRLYAEQYWNIDKIMNKVFLGK